MRGSRDGAALADVAARSRISPSTVSRVLHGEARRRLDPAAVAVGDLAGLDAVTPGVTVLAQAPSGPA